MFSAAYSIFSGWPILSNTQNPLLFPLKINYYKIITDINKVLRRKKRIETRQTWLFFVVRGLEFSFCYLID